MRMCCDLIYDINRISAELSRLNCFLLMDAVNSVSVVDLSRLACILQFKTKATPVKGVIMSLALYY